MVKSEQIVTGLASHSLLTIYYSLFTIHYSLLPLPHAFQRGSRLKGVISKCELRNSKTQPEIRNPQSRPQALCPMLHALCPLIPDPRSLFPAL